MEPIKIQDEMFKKIKKQKAKSIIFLKTDENNKIAMKDNLEFINSKDKKIKRKVKSISSIENIDDLNKKDKKRLGYKKKEEIKVDYSKKDVDKYGLIKVDFYKKMKLVTKMILGVFGAIILAIIIIFASNKIKDLRSKKIAKEINEMTSEKIDYMFVDINPSFAFTVKNNKIENMACRNKDCMDIEKDLEVVGKKVTDAIDYLFNFAKDKGYDTKDGVTIKTTGKIEIDTKKLDYVKIYFIQEKEKNEMLEEIINNDEIKNVDNKSYYEKLWSTLKKDSDYGKVYECEMNGEKLSCYMKKEVFVYSKDESWANVVKVYSNYTSTLTRIFNKFGISYEEEQVIPGLISEMKINIDNNGHKLKFNCDLDGECSNILINENGIFKNRGNLPSGGEFYYFYLYKEAAALDLIHPQELLNGVKMVEDDELDYETVRDYNFFYPEKYPLVIKDKSHGIELEKNSLCNLNTNKCTPYEYIEYKTTFVPANEGYSIEKTGVKKIDKKTYDMYQSFHDFGGYNWGGSQLDKYGSTDYLIKAVVDKELYYVCKDFELNKDTCKKITQNQYDILSNGYSQDGKNIIESRSYSGDKMILNICEFDLETIKKTNCKTQYYLFERHCHKDSCSESYEFLYEK